MISIEQLSGEIAALEEERPTHVIMSKLAALYIVRDHIALDQPAGAVIQTGTVPQPATDSDFARAVTGKRTQDVIALMDEAMDALAVLNPRLYESVLERAKGLTFPAGLV